MAEIDQISKQLGELIGAERENSRQLDAIWKKLDAISREQQETNGLAKEALRMASENERNMREEIKPAVDDYKTLKAKGMGALAMAGLISSGVWTLFAWAMGWFKWGSGP